MGQRKPRRLTPVLILLDWVPDPHPNMTDPDPTEFRSFTLKY
jgi:hypothetical protein